MPISWEASCYNGLLTKAIYKITNNINGKSYIGQSYRPYTRFRQHCADSGEDKRCSLIKKAIRKYGEDNFSFEILEWTENYNQREIDLIQEYNTLAPNGYNILIGGEEPPCLFGTDNPHGFITVKQVDAIIEKLKQCKMSMAQIARSCDPPCSPSTVSDINTGYRHFRSDESYPIRTAHMHQFKRKRGGQHKMFANKHALCTTTKHFLSHMLFVKRKP